MPAVEYSTREVCPQELLLQHLLRAHSIFLLHHARSLADLYVRLTRPKFCATLERFWNRFTRDWDVLLNGTPAVDIYNGLKLAAGGELGIGVGEEDWGSGEREVLEGFIGRTEGLIDVMVSRFGDAEKEAGSGGPPEEQDVWLGSEKLPGSSDGVIFSGIGALTRSSLRSISAWMEWVYKYGQTAYGVKDNPHAPRRRRRRKGSPRDDDMDDAAPTSSATEYIRKDHVGRVPLENKIRYSRITRSKAFHLQLSRPRAALSRKLHPRLKNIRTEMYLHCLLKTLAMVLRR